MYRRRSTQQFESFLPQSVVRAADLAAKQVLAEDRALRLYGKQPANGRDR